MGHRQRPRLGVGNGSGGQATSGRPQAGLHCRGGRCDSTVQPPKMGAGGCIWPSGCECRGVVTLADVGRGEADFASDRLRR